MKTQEIDKEKTIDSWLEIKMKKKVFAFVIDILIVFLLNIILEFVIFFIGVTSENIIKIIPILEIFVFIGYFALTTRLWGNTIGRKILKVKNKYGCRFTGQLEFSKEHLKKDEVLEVTVENKRWVCPSCKEPNISIHDVCDNCGQEVSKNE